VTAVRLVLTLLVRDEADIVAATIEHHLAAGVDFVVAIDNGSLDGTVDVLTAYRDAGVLGLHHEPALDYEQGRWVSRMARRAADTHGADWVINADADEFFWPAGVAVPGPDGLPAALAAVDPAVGQVRAQRDNLIADPALDGGWVRRLVIRDTESRSARGTRIGPKTCHRADPDVTIAQGNHDVSGPRIGPCAAGRALEILHVPDRGYHQFSRKIANGGSAYAANTRLPDQVGWHWREDYARLLAGELPSVHAARQRTPDAIRAGLAAGTLVRDARLRDRLTTLLPNAIVPDALRAVLHGEPCHCGSAGCAEHPAGHLERCVDGVETTRQHDALVRADRVDE
jgi:hypothetical protein